MSSASLSRSERNSDILSEDVMAKTTRRTRAADKTESASKIDVSSNPFFQVLFNQQLSPEQRQADVKSLLVSTLDARKDRERVRQFEDFREWLSEQTTEHAEQIIALTNVDSMSEMQSVIDQMTGDLVGFEDLMGPIMEIIESVYKLRTSGLIEDAYREIEDQRKAEKEREEALAAKSVEAGRTREEIDRMRRRNVELKESRSLFGFGGPSKEARIEMGNNDNKIADLTRDLAKIDGEVEDLKKPIDFTSKHGENAVHVERLRELLDLSQEENRERMIKLREAGTRFINTAKSRTGSLRNQFTATGELIDKVQDNNSGMTKVYAILYEGLSDAERENSQIRSEMNVENEGESLIQRQSREEKLQAIDSHATMLKTNEADTLATYSDLRQQAVRVDTMRNAITMQIDTAKKLNTQGVAATADRIATVLTAISSASLGEASAVANQTLQSMRNSTNEVAKREVVRVALGIEQLADSLVAIVEEMDDLSEIQRHATAISRNGIAELNTRMQEMRVSAETVSQQLKEKRAVVSDASAAESGDAKTETKSGGSSKDLFSNL